MNRIRIWSVAQMLGATCYDVLQVCARLGIRATSNLSSIAIHQVPLIAKILKARYPAVRSFARKAALVLSSLVVTLAVWVGNSCQEQWPVAKYHCREAWRWLRPKLLEAATMAGDRWRVTSAQLGFELRDGSQRIQACSARVLRDRVPHLILSAQLLAMQPAAPVCDFPLVPSYHRYQMAASGNPQLFAT